MPGSRKAGKTPGEALWPVQPRGRRPDSRQPCFARLVVLLYRHSGLLDGQGGVQEEAGRLTWGAGVLYHKYGIIPNWYLWPGRIM